MGWVYMWAGYQRLRGDAYMFLKRGIFTYFLFFFSVVISLTCENVFFYAISFILGLGMGWMVKKI